MAEVNLLARLPKTKRNIQKRAEAKDPAVIAIAKQYGEMYFDGPREYGYGGYKYDGRWIPVAEDIVKHPVRYVGQAPRCKWSFKNLTSSTSSRNPYVRLSKNAASPPQQIHN